VLIENGALDEKWLVEGEPRDVVPAHTGTQSGMARPVKPFDRGGGVTRFASFCGRQVIGEPDWSTWVVP